MVQFDDVMPIKDAFLRFADRAISRPHKSYVRAVHADFIHVCLFSISAVSMCSVSARFGSAGLEPASLVVGSIRRISIIRL